MKFHVKSCRRCGRDEFAIGHVSRAGFCEDCGITVAVERAVQMADKRGPAWEQWLAGMRAFVDRETRGEGS